MFLPRGRPPACDVLSAPTSPCPDPPHRKTARIVLSGDTRTAPARQTVSIAPSEPINPRRGGLRHRTAPSAQRENTPSRLLRAVSVAPSACFSQCWVSRPASCVFLAAIAPSLVSRCLVCVLAALTLPRGPVPARAATPACFNQIQTQLAASVALLERSPTWMLLLAFCALRDFTRRPLAFPLARVAPAGRTRLLSALRVPRSAPTVRRESTRGRGHSLAPLVP